MLRKYWKNRSVDRAPAYDCLSARVVEATGFKAVLMAAGLTGDAQLGMPNLGLATASEIINCAKYIAHSVNIPLIVGVEDGWAERWLPTALYKK